MAAVLDIKDVYFDYVSGDYPRLWTVVGTVQTDEILTPDGARKPIKIGFSYGPPEDWTPDAGEPATAIRWATDHRAAISDRAEQWDTKPENDETLWVATFVPDEFDPLYRFFESLTGDENKEDLSYQPVIVATASFDTGDTANAHFTARAFKRKDLRPRKLWDVGVLIVHGISKYKGNEVLIDFAEPIVKFLEDWVESYNEWSAGRFSQASREKWVSQHSGGASAIRPELLGLPRALDGFKAAVTQHGEDDLDAFHEPSPIVLSVRTHDTQVKGEYAGVALVSVSSIDKQGAIVDGYIGFKEALWADHAIVPKQSEMLKWIRHAYPISMTDYLNRRLNRDYWDPKVLSVASRFVFLILSPAYLVGSLLLVMLLQVLAYIAYIPIAPLQSFVGQVFLTLSGTIGHSYAFTQSSLRRAAISSKVKDDLVWLDAHSQAIAIVSHSQGVAVTNEVLKNRTERWESLRSWHSLGSGLHVLSLLNNKANTVNGTFMKRLGIGMTALFCVFAAALYASEYVFENVDIYMQRALPVGAYFCLLFSVLMLSRRENTSSIDGTLRLTSLAGAKDYHATHDPVCIGGTFNDEDVAKHAHELADYKARSYRAGDPDLKLDPLENFGVSNWHSNLFDHGSYMDNTEEVTSRIALDIMAKVRENAILPEFDELHSEDKARLAVARQYRRTIMPYVALLRFAIWSFVILVVATVFLPVWSPFLQSDSCFVTADADCAELLTGTLPSVNVTQAIVSGLILALLLYEKASLHSYVLQSQQWLLGSKLDRAPKTPFRLTSGVVFTVLLVALAVFWISPGLVQQVLMAASQRL